MQMCVCLTGVTLTTPLDTSSTHTSSARRQRPMRAFHFKRHDMQVMVANGDRVGSSGLGYGLP